MVGVGVAPLLDIRVGHRHGEELVEAVGVGLGIEIGGHEHLAEEEGERSFPFGGPGCDSRQGAGDGSKVYEVNMPMWRFGRGKTRYMSVSEAEEKRAERLAVAKQQGAETADKGLLASSGNG